MSSTVADQEVAEAAASNPVVDRLGRQIALGALAVFVTVMAGTLTGRDPLSAVVLAVMAAGILAFAARLPR